MRYRSTPILVACVMICLAPLAAFGQITPYFQDFELMIQTDPNALIAEGWLVFGNVYESDGTSFIYNYGPFGAPNSSAGPPDAFSAIASNEGGIDQGLQQLSIFNDYNNADHRNEFAGRVIESNVYREYTVIAANVGERWKFAWQAKKTPAPFGVAGNSTAAGFIKTIDPNAGFILTKQRTWDMTNIPEEWGGYQVYLDIDAGMVGQLLQIGFINTAASDEPSGIIYDNVLFEIDTVTDTPAAMEGFSLAQNSPNPFNPRTRVEFSLPVAGPVDITVYDLAGRHVATLTKQEYLAGDYAVEWDGRNDSGDTVSSGHYRYVLRTPQGEISRGMTLLK